jgi:CheY-like chemotaxis protein
MALLHHILLVDDDPVYTLMAEYVVNKVHPGTKIDKASNGQVALDFIQNANNEMPDLILLDINMPIKNGWEFLDDFQTVKLQLNKVPNVVIVSSSVSEVDINKAKTYGDVKDYITKPFLEQQFREVEDRLFFQ